jgi:hypothetical protein
MKIYIMTDMEGVAGVLDHDNCYAREGGASREREGNEASPRLQVHVMALVAEQDDARGRLQVGLFTAIRTVLEPDGLQSLVQKLSRGELHGRTALCV